MSKCTEHIFSVALERSVGATARCATLIEKKISDVYRDAGIGPNSVGGGTARHAGEGRLTEGSAARGITARIQWTVGVRRPTVLLEIRQRLPLNGKARRSTGRPGTEPNVN